MTIGKHTIKLFYTPWNKKALKITHTTEQTEIKLWKITITLNKQK